MTFNTRIVRRFLPGLVCALAISASANAQTAARPALTNPIVVEQTGATVEPFVLPEPQPDLFVQPSATHVPDPVVLAGPGGYARGIGPRPDDRLMFGAQNGLHVSFVTPTAPRESEHLRVQGSLALLSAFVSQRNASRPAPVPAEPPASSCVAGER